MELLKNLLESGSDSLHMAEYKECVSDLLEQEITRSMKQYIQHGDVNCLEHSLYVSYVSYKVCKKFGLDHRAAARGGLLHDFFLYDWHHGKPYQGLHGFHHPAVALRNADKHFTLTKVEKDIIEKHMWPLTRAFPKYNVSFVVLLVDKYCAVMETLRFGKKDKQRRFDEIFEA